MRDASLELEVGEFVSIVGRSGSGKSTLMAMLGALTRPTEGKLLLDGTDVWTLSEAELATFRSRCIGFIFQFPSLLSNLTAVDNVAVPALLGRTMDAAQAYARAYDLLARVGLRGPRRRVSRQHVRRRAAPRRHCPCARSIRRRCCSPTSRPAISTKTPRPTSSICSSNCSGRNRSASCSSPITWNWPSARGAAYEMRQGMLAATDLPQIAVDPERPRHFGPAQGRTRRRTLALPAAAVACRPSAWAPTCGAASRLSCWQERSSSAASCWPISGSTNIKRCGFGSAPRGSRPCSTWRSTACAATSSRSPISATGATN